MAEDAKQSLLDRARAKTAERQASRCTVAKMLGAWPGLAPQINDLIAAAAAEGDDMTYDVAAEVIGEAISEKVVAQTLSRHFRRKCSCP